MKKQPFRDSGNWLEQAFPQVHFLLLALDGKIKAQEWLIENSHGVSLLTRALKGESHALDGIKNGHGADLDDLFEMINNEDLCAWLGERRPEVDLLFRSIKGDDQALDQLKNRNRSFADVVPPLRLVHHRFLSRTRPMNGQLEEDEMADMGCLIGEMHFKKAEYQKAIEAFSRAIENQPAPDLYQGRAKAYRMLAERDEHAAALLRQRQD